MASLIPAPAHLKRSEGVFLLPERWGVDCPPEFAEALAGFQDMAKQWDVTLPETTPGQDFVLTLNPSLPKEGYRLHVRSGGIEIQASDHQGACWGLQTLLQLIRERTIPALDIEDSPRFAWRGGHLDVCRHFMPLDFVKRFIDLLAMHKFNTFHWHLTEDQGWRIEIKRYPKLTEIGAWRDETVVGHAREPQGFDGTAHGGYYTQDEAREIVAYAHRRGITVVPEIEMPGHAQAAVASYPELGQAPEPVKVWTTFGVTEHVYNVSDNTLAFLRNVLDEVMDIFPGPYIHIGGDECPKTEWKNSSEAQARIQQEGLKDEDELQSWFIRQFDAYLTSKGRKLVGWDEILEGGLAPGATVMSWRGEEGGIEAAKQGKDVVMTPGAWTYFDHYQSENRDSEPLAIGGCTPLKKVYENEPIPAGLPESARAHVLGSQFQTWTEYMPNPAHVEFMILPRMLALSEVLWSPRSLRSWEDFLARCRDSVAWLASRGVNHRALD